MCQIFGSMFYYADDTCIYLSGNDLEHINADLLTLNEWYKADKLTLNVDNTFDMVFHRAKIKTDNHKLSSGQATLRETNQYKYVGI